ncbi:uncharacterized protein [Chironomus tepperi]|uniref:uncharacterized protein isoform X1 n=1 Tax=Chironomus tepperi TaxID=113505 RepID=UPI00391FC4E2
MFKIILLLLSMTFGTSQAVSFNCSYSSTSWTTLGSIYTCEVHNSATITSLDAAQIDSVSGTHQLGHNNDIVEAFSILYKGLIHYFPRNLNKIFKNLKAIQIYDAGLKEIRQGDLKYFPNLMILYLDHNNLGILEKDLFSFNPNLEVMSLYGNRITHIDPNVFDRLTKLKSLNLEFNTCISMNAANNSAVQNVIKTASTKCSNSDYLNLQHKVKNLEAASVNLTSDELKEKLENLENKFKNSTFLNFFQGTLDVIKAVQVKKAQEEAATIKSEACSALEAQMDEKIADLKEIVSKLQSIMSSSVKNEAAVSCKEVNEVSKINEKIDVKFDEIERKLEEKIEEIVKKK